MSDDLSAIHAQTSAILEKLYDEKGQPDELDEAFTQEYFQLVEENVNIQVDDAELEEDEDGPAARALGPRKTDAKLSQRDRGLIEVDIPSKREKFVVSRVAAVRTLTGTSQRVGPARGRGKYVMTTIRGIPNITIKSDRGRGIVHFIGLPNSVKAESGNGVWERV